jgi:hypothetical protein
MKRFNQIRKYGARMVNGATAKVAAGGTALVTLSQSITARAESVLDTTQMTAYATNVADTGDELKAWLIGIVFTLGLVFFAVNMTKKGVRKAGGN